jgi:hypothetical protein
VNEPRWKLKVKVASLQTLYHLVQIRAAWRACLARDAAPPGNADRVPASGTEDKG